MLRVLIADDEERICQLIQALGEWQRLKLEVVGTSSNGPDTLSLIRTLKPDILITDIRMPGCDGLQVVEEAHKIMSSLEVIVISGYAQFDYAQTAIRFGVGEYLLKPINRVALNHSLEKMAARCLARQQKETDIESLLESQQDDRQLLRLKLIADLSAGRLDAFGSAALERTYHFTASQDASQFILLKMDYNPDCFGEASLAIVRGKAQSLIAPVLQTLCADAVLDFIPIGLIGVVNYPHERQEALRTQLRNALNQLVVERDLFGPIEFSLALGPLCLTLRELAASYSATLNIAAECLTEGTGQLLEGLAGPSGLMEMDYQTRYAEAAAHAIDVMNLEEATAAVALLEEATTVPGVRGWELLALVRGAGLIFITRLNAEQSDGVLAAYYTRLSLCSATSALFECLRKLQCDQLLLLAQRLRDRDTQPIRNAKLYIRKNFAQPITLEEVSAAIGFSVNYFSTLFKKETGSGFAKYLTHIRMDEARTLLRDTNHSIAEICKSVGYGDLKHFTHTFRTETGLTPGEYRKLYG
ncbi:MAG: helix-turn-helix domain-containing protein [Eubacteriales bacterium]|nr:helix-turn-helix domain-containing protein [Eubacteriales bacterium]